MSLKGTLWRIDGYRRMNTSSLPDASRVSILTEYGARITFPWCYNSAQFTEQLEALGFHPTEYDDVAMPVIPTRQPVELTKEGWRTITAAA